MGRYPCFELIELIKDGSNKEEINLPFLLFPYICKNIQ